jgi:NADH-quinone oxidoreductase subunit J
MNDPINWQSFFFLLFALVACVFAIGVVLSSNIVRMAFYLILSLGATSGLFFLAHADFVAAMQLMIYVGGTLVLLIFGVMLTAQSPFISMKTRGGEWILAAILGGSLLAVLVQTAIRIPDWTLPAPVASSDEHQESARDESTAGGTHSATVRLASTEATETVEADAADAEPPEDPRTATRIGLALTGPRVDRLDESNPIIREGMAGYLLPFEIVSVHLLVVLIGAAYLARTKRRAARN